MNTKCIIIIIISIDDFILFFYADALQQISPLILNWFVLEYIYEN